MQPATASGKPARRGSKQISPDPPSAAHLYPVLDGSSAAASSSPPRQLPVPSPDPAFLLPSPPPTSGQRHVSDDGSSAEELAARQAMVRALDGRVSTDEASFAAAVAAAERAKAEIKARNNSMTAAANASSAQMSAVLAHAAAASASSGSLSADPPPQALLKAMRVPSLQRQPSAPDTLSTTDWNASANSPPREPPGRPPQHAQNTQHVSFAVSPPHHSAQAPSTSSSGAGIGNKLGASPAFGPRHQSLPDLTSLAGADDDLPPLDGGYAASGEPAISSHPVQFNHLAQRPSADMFGGGSSSSSSSGRRPSIGNGSSALPPRKSSGAGSSALLEPLLVPHSSDDDFVYLPAPSPNTAARQDDEKLKESRAIEIENHSKGLGRRQLRVMLYKNWLLKRRHVSQFLCEVFSPLLMVMVIVGGWLFSLPHVDNNDAERFANATTTVEEVFEWVTQHVVDIPTTMAAADLALEASVVDFSAEAQRIWWDAQQHSQQDDPTDALRRRRNLRESLPDVESEDDLQFSGLLEASSFDTDADLDLSSYPSLASSQVGDFSFFSALRSDGDYFPYRHQLQPEPRSSTALGSATFNESERTNHQRRKGTSLWRGAALKHYADLARAAKLTKSMQRLPPRASNADADAPALASVADDPSPPPSDRCFPLPELPGHKQFCYGDGDTDLIQLMLEYNGPLHIPSFDEFVTTHFVLEYLLNNNTETFQDLNDNVDKLDQLTNGRLANIIFLGKLMFTPDTPAVRALVARLNATHSTFNQVFTGIVSSEEGAIDIAIHNVRTDHDRTWAVIAFNALDMDAGVLDLTIRMNSSVLPTTTFIQDRFQPGIDEDYKRYFWSGFLTLQTMIENVALNISAGAAGRDARRTHAKGFPTALSDDDPSIVPLNSAQTREEALTAIPFPVAPYEGNSFYSSVGPVVGLVFCMSMLYPTSRLIKGIVEEKETKTKETLKMMGLKDWVFHCSWFITFFAQFVLTSAALVLLLHFTMLPHTDVSLLLAFFVTFALSQITLGFLMTVFFSKAKLAGVLGPILLFALTMPRYAFYASDSGEGGGDSNVLSKTFVSLLSPTAFTFGADLLMQYEGAYLPFGWDNLWDDPFSMGRVLLFLLGDFVLYAVLAWYLDHVVPNEYGGRLSVWFPCQRSYWRDAVEVDFPEEYDDSSPGNGSGSNLTAAQKSAAIIEPVDPSMHSKARVRIKKLCKQFTEGRGSDKRTTYAVAGLDLTLYEGQITALLGHNGAGKSTTISMMNGLIAPTSGDCSIHGFSILRNMKEIRKSLGVCPQQNVLWSRLTVTEHLRIYATLKGVKDAVREAEVTKKIEEVGLSDKTDIYSSALSGGGQRKLQCAMALIGDSKVVFLDEPTSGMDPYSRRSTWELLRNAKKDRVIVLTTHFMDEADLLGDRIAIMSEGQLRCVGSALFLKSKYGIGYNLTMVKASKMCRTDQVSKMVMFFCPEARILSTAGGEMSYRLPWSSVGQFPGLFQQLEERRHHMGIGGYGISSTTLEEVFLRCAHLATLPASAGSGNPNDDEEPSKPVRKHSNSGAQARPVLAAQQPSLPTRKLSGSGIASSTPPRHPNGPPKDLLVSTNAPLAVSALSPSSVSSSDSFSAGAAAGSHANGSSDPAEKFPSLPQRTKATNWIQFRACIIKRYTCARRDLAGRFFEVILPIAVIALVLLILMLNKASEGKNILMKAELYTKLDAPGPTYVPFWVSQPTPVVEPATVYGLDHLRGRSSSQSMWRVDVKNLTDSTQMQEELLATSKTHTGYRYGALLLNDTLYSAFNASGYQPHMIFTDHPALTFMHNTTFFHSGPVIVAEIAEARWNANRWAAQSMAAGGVPLAPGNLSRVSYALRNHPLPLTASQSLKTKTYLTLFAALFMLIPFCYLPASFVLFVVKERSEKSKHLQFVSGLNPNMYWAANFCWDLMQYVWIVVAVMLVMLAYSSESYVGTMQAFWATFSLLLLYGLAAIPLCYCYSFCFDSYTSAQVGIAGLNFLTGFLLVIAAFMLDQLDSTVELNKQLKFFYRVFPSYSLGEGLINLSTRDFQAFIHGLPKPNPFAWEVSGRNLTYLACESAGYMLLTLALESSKLHRAVRLLFNFSGEMADPGPEVVAEEDVDVAAERRRVQRMRVKVMKTNSEGHASFAGLSSPVTPGDGLKRSNGEPGAPAFSFGEFQPTWAAATLNSTRSPEQVMTSPYREPASTKRARADSKDSVLSSGSVSDGLRSPLLGPNERMASAVEEQKVANWPEKQKSTTLELTPSPGDSCSAPSPSLSVASSISASYPDEEPGEPEDDILIVQHLRKVYPARGGGKVTVAVDNLSLGVPRGQVFGFLGINGAGKTTTMKMLTGDIPISKGRAYINGFSVVKQLDEVRKEIGYCPQFDPLLGLMTSRETLSLYARLHGLPEASIPALVQKMMNTLGLSRFADKQCGSYSGGNKRKLSLAIALIGDPSVVFLDEPSTGMDPVSRRFMWSVIESISDGRSVILTTHSMEECEALCSRIGIMAAGALQCLGTIQHLKSRYGAGYGMDINTAEFAVPQVQAFVAKHYPQSKLEQAHGGRLKYHLPQHGVTLSSVFSSMEAHKRQLHITDYSISQSSLETIFINQVSGEAKKNREHDEQPGASP